VKTSGAKQIAERYVKALFDASAKAQDAVEKDLLALESVFSESEEFQSLLSNPLLTREQQAKAADAVLAKIKANKITRQFIALLARQKRLDLLPDIIALYMDKAMAERGEMKAEVISATPLKAADIAAISAKLGGMYGKKILLETREDKELLGGVVIKIGSLQLDSSLSGKLQRLALILRAA
jgi:F-type H+-transporting ATPase subunit delta